jgi:hypothetical protein
MGKVWRQNPENDPVENERCDSVEWMSRLQSCTAPANLLLQTYVRKVVPSFFYFRTAYGNSIS